MDAAEFKTDLGNVESPTDTYAFALTVFSLVPYLGILFSIPALTVTAASILDRNRKSRTPSTFLFCLLASFDSGNASRFMGFVISCSGAFDR